MQSFWPLLLYILPFPAQVYAMKECASFVDSSSVVHPEILNIFLSLDCHIIAKRFVRETLHFCFGIAEVEIMIFLCGRDKTKKLDIMIISGHLSYCSFPHDFWECFNIKISGVVRKSLFVHWMGLNICFSHALVTTCPNYSQELVIVMYKAVWLKNPSFCSLKNALLLLMGSSISPPTSRHILYIYVSFGCLFNPDRADQAHIFSTSDELSDYQWKQAARIGTPEHH